MISIAVYLPDSPVANDWRSAFERCAAELIKSTALPDASLEVSVEVTSCLQTFENSLADHRYIFWSSLDGYRRDFPIKDDPTFGRDVQVSRALAKLSELAAGGATIVDAHLASVTIGGIGEISRASGLVDRAAPADRQAEANPLTIYRNIPPAIADSATWPLHLFFDLSGQIQAFDIDLTGRDRFLFYGPYIDLPPGDWGVTLMFRFEGENLAEPMISIEWGFGESYVMQEFTLKASGFYRIALRRTWADIQPAQLRLRLMRPVFHGLLTDIIIVAEKLPGLVSPD